MPPNVPAERVDAIRRAFDATMKDKEFLAEAEKLKIEIDPLTGEQVAALIVRHLQDAGRDRRARPRRDGAEVTRSVIPRHGRSAGPGNPMIRSLESDSGFAADARGMPRR